MKAQDDRYAYHLVDVFVKDNEGYFSLIEPTLYAENENGLRVF